MLPIHIPLEIILISTTILCVPLIIFGYIVSIIKAIKDRRIILKILEYRKLQELKLKRCARLSCKGVSGFQSQTFKEFTVDEGDPDLEGKMSKKVLEKKLATQAQENMATQERKEASLSGTAKHDMAAEYSLTSPKNVNSNNALMLPLTETDIGDIGWDQSCGCELFRTCKLKGRMTAIKHNHSTRPGHSKPGHSPARTNACCGDEYLQERST